jgi:hypothetical protein
MDKTVSQGKVGGTFEALHRNAFIILIVLATLTLDVLAVLLVFAR